MAFRGLTFIWLLHGQWVTWMGSIGHVLKYGQVMFICYMAYCPIHFRCAKDVYDFLYGSRMFTAVGGLVHPRKFHPLHPPWFLVCTATWEGINHSWLGTKTLYPHEDPIKNHYLQMILT